MPSERVFAPGRVNLIGDHTDHAGGLALPMAIHLGTTIQFERGGDVVALTSDVEPVRAVVPLDVVDPASVTPDWARYVAGVVTELRPRVGLRGAVTTDLPVGGGLSSSAALEVAVALALGGPRDALALARLCQRAEQRGPRVPCGLMDQITCVAAIPGHALFVDFLAETWWPVPMPESLAVHVVHCGVHRRLDTSSYAQRRRECEAAAAEIGPLRAASVEDLGAIRDPVARRRARHVVTENGRVRAMIHALRTDDMETAGALLRYSHRSLRDDFEVSIPELDDLVERLSDTPGVHGARLTGAGFGGCVVVFADSAADLESFGGWRVLASGGALSPGRAGSSTS
jgi:galactokinase